MRTHRRTLRASLCALVLTGCGGPAAAAGGGTTAAQSPDPCHQEGELRLGRICWNPVGSRWHVTANAPGGEYAFDVELLPANRLRATDHPAAGPATDEWFVEGNTLRLFLANRFVEYRAHVTNGTVLVGEAINVRGDVWEWRGDRMPTGRNCQPDEAPLDGACFAVAGTHWTLRSSRGDERVIHFDAGGRLHVDGSDVEGTWTQEGARVRFTLDGGEYIATIAGSTAQLRGEGFTAERIPLYPPPMH
jgi:hypothetical protein